MGQVMKLLMALSMACFLMVFMGCSSSEDSSSTMAESDDVEMDDMGSDSDLSVGSSSDSNDAGPLRSVNFAYDSAVLDESARMALDENAVYLKENGTVAVQIEGHCDERGGVQYNLALGERRGQCGEGLPDRHGGLL